MHISREVLENTGLARLAPALLPLSASRGWTGSPRGKAMETERWEIDSSHSSVHFAVRHLVIAKVRGSFARWSGTVQVPDGDFSKATVAVTIDASSIDTGV